MDTYELGQALQHLDSLKSHPTTQQKQERKWKRGDASKVTSAYSNASPLSPQRSRSPSPRVRPSPPSRKPTVEPWRIYRASEDVEPQRFPQVKPSPSPEAQRSRPAFGCTERRSLAEHLDTPTVVAYPNATTHHGFISPHIESKHADRGTISFGPGFGKAVERGDGDKEGEDELLRRLSGKRCELIDELRAAIEARLIQQQRELGMDITSDSAVAVRLDYLERQWETLAVGHDAFRVALSNMGVLKSGGEKKTVAAIIRRLDPPGDEGQHPSGRILLRTLDGTLRWATKLRKSAYVVQKPEAPAWRKALGAGASLEEQL